MESINKKKIAQSFKSTKQITDKGVKKKSSIQEQQKNVHKNNKQDETSLKGISSQKKLEENLKARCYCRKSLSSSSVLSVVVCDRATQYPETCDNSRFSEFNPVRTLNFLIKELGDLITKDKRTSEILTEMEQILSRISICSGKSIFENLETIAMYSKVEESTAKVKELKDLSKKMKAKYELLVSERELLQSQIQNQDARLKEANQKQANLKDRMNILTLRLEEADRAAEIKDKTISALKQQMKNNDSEKLISDLKTELTKQIELAHNRHCEIEYLKIEKDKLSVLCSYKDTLNIELRDTITELQSHMSGLLLELATLHKAYLKGGNVSPQVMYTEPVSSSSISSPSIHNPIDGHDLSDLFEQQEQEHITLKKDTTRYPMHFVSLPGDDTTHSIMFNSQNQDTNTEETVAQHRTKK